MSPRAGPEDKLPWRQVPRAVRAATDAALGGDVIRAVRAWGGYAPSATFRLLLADRRRAFFKGVHSGSNDHMRAALVVEERAYRELAGEIGPWAPALLGAFRLSDWHVLLLDDLGPPSAPPWTHRDLRAAARGLAELHRRDLGRTLPEWLPREHHLEFSQTWDQLAAEDGAARLLALAGDSADAAERWLREEVPALSASARLLANAPEPHTVLHFDARSDNLRIVDGRLRLFDWNWASVGPPEIDLAAFAQSVTVEVAARPEQVVRLYTEVLRVREDVLTSAVAGIAGYLLRGFWLPEVPGLPRLRAFQRQQAFVTHFWAARRLSLPEPVWLGRLV